MSVLINKIREGLAICVGGSGDAMEKYCIDKDIMIGLAMLDVVGIKDRIIEYLYALSQHKDYDFRVNLKKQYE